MPTTDEVAALVSFFRDRSLKPRLEYVPAAAPAVESVLASAGFVVEGRPPLMACRPGEVASPGPVDGITVRLVTSPADLLGVATAQNQAYADPEVDSEPPGLLDVARMQRTIGGGGVVVLARDAASGEPVGGGQCSGPVDGVSELAAIGVVASHRRRGIAMAMTALLTTAAHARGARLVWLEAGRRAGSCGVRPGRFPRERLEDLDLPGLTHRCAA